MAEKIQWVMRHHLPQIVDIANSEYGTELTVRELASDLQGDPDLHAIAAVRHRRRVVAYAFYTTQVDGAVELLDLVVKPPCRRKGIATRLLRYIAEHRVSDMRPTMVAPCVPERDLAAQLWLKQCGFVVKPGDVLRVVGQEDEYTFTKHFDRMTRCAQQV